MLITLNENDLRNMVGSLVNKLLNEGTDILYHFTNLKGLMNIMRTNSFKLSNNRKETEGGNVMSFSRTKTNPYMYCLVNGGEDWYIRLTIDGRRLNQKYKTYPINDLYTYPEDVRRAFSTMSKKERSEYKFGQEHWIPKEDPSNKNTDFEYEDRLVSDLRRVPDAMSYITRIDIFPEEVWCSGPSLTKARRFVKDLLSQYKDMVHVYSDFKSFKIQNPAGEIPQEYLLKYVYL